MLLLCTFSSAAPVHMSLDADELSVPRLSLYTDNLENIMLTLGYE